MTIMGEHAIYSKWLGSAFR